MPWSERSDRVREGLGVLGVSAGTDPRRLRKAYLAAVKAAHPDRPGGDPARLRRVVEAYHLLRSQPRPALRPSMKTAPPRLEITPSEAARGGVRSVELEGVGRVDARLPAGLRAGDRVRISGVLMQVAVSAGDGVAVVGDHLCMTVEVDRSTMTGGGSLDVSTPTGTVQVEVSPQDAIRGLVRVLGKGLPARGRNAQGHLFLRLCAQGAASRSR
jgi:curved DNA-binding protein